MESQEFSINRQQVSEWKYIFDQSVFWQFSSDLANGTTTGFSIADFFQSNSDYVVKFTYYPIRIEMFADTIIGVDSIKIGKKSLSYNAWGLSKVKNYIELFHVSPSRPFNNFLDFSPYTKISLIVPYFEKIDIQPELVYGTTLYGYVSVDFNNGSMTLYLYANSRFIDSRTCKIGIDVALGKGNKDEQMRNNVLQGITALGSAVGLGVGVYTGNPLITAGSVAMLTGNVTKALQNNVDRLTGYKGGSGSRDMLAVDKTIKLVYETPTNITQPNAHLRGRMMNANATLNTLTGFTQIGEIHFEPKGYDIYGDEISEIVELLKTGVVL